jgi:hypothetical protein
MTLSNFLPSKCHPSLLKQMKTASEDVQLVTLARLRSALCGGAAL